jgi:hypothetical protein
LDDKGLAAVIETSRARYQRLESGPEKRGELQRQMSRTETMSLGPSTCAERDDFKSVHHHVGSQSNHSSRRKPQRNNAGNLHVVLANCACHESIVFLCRSSSDNNSKLKPFFVSSSLKSSEMKSTFIGVARSRNWMTHWLSRMAYPVSPPPIPIKDSSHDRKTFG